MSRARGPLQVVASFLFVLQNKLGGGEGIEGLYGSLTRTGMQKVLHSLSKSCGLDKSSRLVDVGAGLGRYVANAQQMCTHMKSFFMVRLINRVLHVRAAACYAAATSKPACRKVGETLVKHLLKVTAGTAKHTSYPQIPLTC